MRGVPAWVQLKEMLWGLSISLLVVFMIVETLMLIGDAMGVISVIGVVHR